MVNCCICGGYKKPLHRFPKNDKLFREWMMVINNRKILNLPKDQVLDGFRVCNRHFRDEVIVSGSKRGLTRNAVPTLHLPSGSPSTSRTAKTQIEVPSSTVPLEMFELHLDSPSTSQTERCPIEDPISEPPSKILKLCSDSGIQSQMQQSEDSKRTMISDQVFQEHAYSSMDREKTLPQSRVTAVHHGVRRRSILQSAGVTRQKDLTPKAKLFYSKLIKSANRISKLSTRLKSFQERTEAAEQLLHSGNFNQILEHVNRPTYNFILSQIRNQKKAREARRYSIDEKVLAITLLKASAKRYRMLSKIFSLPSKRTLAKMLDNIPSYCGFNSEIFESLKVAVGKMKNKDKTCIIIFDEMTLDLGIKYNSKEDYIIGLEDSGDTRSAKLADHANVIMAKGVYKQWKQPLCFTFSSGPIKSIALKKILKEAISNCQSIGLNVIATVCDQGGSNVTAINMLLKERREECLRENLENTYFGFSVNGNEIVPLFDPPHLIKGFRNNLLTKDLYFEKDNEKFITKWDHIVQFYMLDMADEFRICHNLTDRHIFKEKINKMKVSYCTQVFSNRVGSVMRRIIKWKADVALDPAAIGTATAILFFDKLLDSLNSYSEKGPPGKSLLAALKMCSCHEEFWREAIKILNSMKYFCPEKKKFIVVPSIRNTIFTLKGLLHLKHKLIKDVKSPYLTIRPFQQDALENFFGFIRSHGVRNVKPTASHFKTSFISLIVNNFMAAHSPSFNCEDDLSEGGLSNLRSFVDKNLSGIVPLEDCDIVIPDIPKPVLLNRRSKISKCTVTYIAGAIAKICLKHEKCANCRYNILVRHDANDLDFIEERDYTGSSLIKPGNYFNFIVSQSLSRLFYLIPRVCHYKNISKILFNTIFNEIQFNLLNCPEHKVQGENICRVIIRCSLFFWCKRINLVAKGKDEKYVRFLRTDPNRLLLDPVKLMAHNMYLKKRTFLKKK